MHTLRELKYTNISIITAWGHNLALLCMLFSLSLRDFKILTCLTSLDLIRGHPVPVSKVLICLLLYESNDVILVDVSH